MAFCDFVVKYDPAKDKPEDITHRILYSIFIGRLKNNKPVNIFLGGSSGEGKSWTAILLQQILFEIQGLNLADYFRACNILTPLEYSEKLDALLHDKDLKKANILVLHEAREVVKAKLWHSFITQAIADVNAMSRTVKRLCTIIISQFIRDITSDVRYTLDYYCIVRRPKGKRPRLYINVMWKDDRDLEKPRLRKRKLSGYLVINGRYRRFVPKYLECRPPRKEFTEIFEKMDYEAKSGIIKNKLARLMDEIKADAGIQSNKVINMVNWYLKHPDNLALIGKRYRNKWKMKPDARGLHDMTRDEAERFETLLNEKFKEKGVVEHGEAEREI